MKIEDFPRAIKQNYFARLLVKPYYDLRRYKIKKRYESSGEANRVKIFKDKYLGERCFIVGNGPSLTTDDLDRLKDEKTFGSNYIDQLFSKVKWRPTFYLCMDRLVINDKNTQLNEIQSEYKFLDICAKKYIKNTEKVFYLLTHEVFKADTKKLEKPFFSDQVDRVVCGGKTVTYVAIQLAAYMGFKEIYLIGVDNSFKKFVNAEGKVVVDDNKQNHAKGIDNHNIGIAYVDAMQESFEEARIFCRTRDIKIYNATRGGALEVFERVNFDSVV